MKRLPPAFVVERREGYFVLVRVRPRALVASSVGDCDLDREYMEWFAVLANRTNAEAEE